MSVNSYIYSGAVISTEIKYTPSGLMILELRAAGRTPNSVNYHQVTFFGGLAESVEQRVSAALSKHEHVGMIATGRLKYRSWKTADGSSRSAVGIVGESLDLFLPPPERIELDSKNQPILLQAENRFLGHGNLTRDPVTRDLPSGDPYTTATIAVNRRVPTNGGWNTETDYLTLVAYGEAAQTLRKLTKGAGVFVQGEFNVNSWTDRHGDRKYSHTVVGYYIQPVLAYSYR